MHGGRASPNSCFNRLQWPIVGLTSPDKAAFPHMSPIRSSQGRAPAPALYFLPLLQFHLRLSSDDYSAWLHCTLFIQPCGSVPWPWNMLWNMWSVGPSNKSVGIFCLLFIYTFGLELANSGGVILQSTICKNYCSSQEYWHEINTFLIPILLFPRITIRNDTIIETMAATIHNTLIIQTSTIHYSNEH